MRNSETILPLLISIFILSGCKGDEEISSASPVYTSQIPTLNPGNNPVVYGGETAPKTRRRTLRQTSNVRPTSPAITPVTEDPFDGAVGMSPNQILKRLDKCPNVRDQGRQPACTAFAMMGAAMMVLPEEVAATLPYNDKDISKIFESDQRSFPYMSDAISPLNNQRPPDHRLITTPIQNYNEAIACLRLGGAPFVRILVTEKFEDFHDSRERRITELPVLNCGGDGMGHAVFAVGSTKDGDLIIQNSWGIHWGFKGRAIIRGQTCKLEGYCVQRQNN